MGQRDLLGGFHHDRRAGETDTGRPAEIDATGTSGGDLILGNDAANLIRALAGGDRIVGRSGDDRIVGRSGDDCIVDRSCDDCIVDGDGAADLVIIAPGYEFGLDEILMWRGRGA